MALTQSARLAGMGGPSWDEEVVPALRKRLESESRTLARRMSAISLSSVEDVSTAPYSAYPDKTLRQRQVSPTSNSSHQSSSSAAQRPYQRQAPADRTMPAAPARVSNGAPSSKPNTNTKTDFQRARTYSSPYASDLPNGHANGNARTSTTSSQSSSTNPARALSPRPADAKPTRIPKATRPPMSQPSSAANSPHLNGHSPSVTPFALSPGLIPSSSTQSTGELLSRAHRQPSGLLHEAPPFPTDASASSGFTPQPQPPRNGSLEEAPARASTDSEERPYEHWYRGEVSRNGGVGELRVGRRQEMLDIANYGHLIASRRPGAAQGGGPAAAKDDNAGGAPPRRRRRAGSIAGMTHKERESIYLDEEHVDAGGRVLDEHPPTDWDGEAEDGSEAHSLEEAGGGGAYAYIPRAGEAAPSGEWTTVAGAHERSTTPTPSMLPRPSSRQQQMQPPPPTRIPGPASRRSSESRAAPGTPPVIGGVYSNTTTNNTNAINNTNNTSTSSSSKSPAASPPGASASFNSRQPTATLSASPPSSAAQQKRGLSPGAAKKAARGPAAKAKTKSKASSPPGKQAQVDLRGSVAYYPTPLGDGEDMADAIPSWTQPVPRAGNWDEVVLPVVARKKGLDGHYEEADGSPKPRKVDNTVAPAPGTFGFDGTKYRPARGGDNFVSIPMDEFGRAAAPHSPSSDPATAGRPDAHGHPPPGVVGSNPDSHRQLSPSPAPFAHYAPPAATTATITLGGGPGPGRQEEEEEGKGGCCKCVVM
ncbi:hypothetical protein BJ912DRAFT_902333 [Pholiota molesta]|nr:hypothetical protein BJ912DRAFT_902333 [Pholiota molesta]